MSQTLSILTVFHALTADQQDTWDSLLGAIEQLNPVLERTIGCRLVAMNFRTLPAQATRSGRTQDILNEQIDVCDLFVMTLGDSLGRPTSEADGGYAILEEFNRAKKRFERHGAPQLAIYFRGIGNRENSVDKGEVSRFRDRISGVLWREYYEPHELRELLVGDLSSHASRLMRSKQWHDGQAAAGRLFDGQSRSQKTPEPLRSTALDKLSQDKWLWRMPEMAIVSTSFNLNKSEPRDTGAGHSDVLLKVVRYIERVGDHILSTGDWQGANGLYRLAIEACRAAKVRGEVPRIKLKIVRLE